MSLTWSRLLSGLVWLWLFICLLASHCEMHSDSPSVQPVVQKKEALDRLILDFDQAVRSRIKAKGMGPLARGECHLSDEELEAVLDSYGTHYGYLPNGFNVQHVTALRGYPTLTSCSDEAIDLLASGQKAIDADEFLYYKCIKLYMLQNLFGYLELCGKIRGPDFVEQKRKHFGLDKLDADKFLVPLGNSISDQDPNYIDPTVSKTIRQFTFLACHDGPDKVEKVLRNVADKDKTWLAGASVRLILSAMSHQVWNCQSERLARHLEAKDRFVNVFDDASSCMNGFYARIYSDLIEYCKKSIKEFDESKVTDYLKRIEREREGSLIEAVQSVLPASNKFRLDVEKFVDSGNKDDFKNRYYDDLIENGRKKYLESCKGSTELSLKTSCEHVIKALDSINFMSLYSSLMDESLGKMLKAYQMCKLFMQVDLNPPADVQIEEESIPIAHPI